MAKISLNDAAPSGETITFLLANEEIKLGGDADASYDTDDLSVLANVEAHPWLTIEYPDPSPEDPQPDPVIEETPRPLVFADHYQETHE